VYCEGQGGAHCGAHSLAPLFGRQITSDPNCLVPLLTQWQRDEGLMHRIYADQTYFSPSGMYTIQALNHWLYKMVEEPVTLMPFLELTYCPPGTSYLSRHNRASIMEAAPSGCKAIMIHYHGGGGGICGTPIAVKATCVDLDLRSCCTTFRDVYNGSMVCSRP
jgi:hypothetical protein